MSYGLATRDYASTDFHDNFAESMFNVRLKSSKWYFYDDIYAVNDDDESDNEDVTMVTALQ